MRNIWLILRWEARRVFSNWKQALSVFVIPSFVLLLSLYMLPVLIDYLSSGNLGRPVVYLVDAPDSFITYTEKETTNPLYRFDTITRAEFENDLVSGRAYELAQQGHCFALFSSFPHVDYPSDVPSLFEYPIEQLYQATISGDAEYGSLSFVLVFADPQNPKSAAVGETFLDFSLVEYEDDLLDTLGSEYKKAGGGPAFSTNDFHPYNDLMRFRNAANYAVGRVMPAIVSLILYYCIYSLTGEMLVADRSGGFLSKVALTPVKKSHIIAGKAGAIVLIGILNSLIIIGMLTVTSWVNVQNSPFSLIPFGFILFPTQLLLIMPVIFLLTLLLTGYCFKTVFDHNRPQDAQFNLQFPLILFLFIFFAQIFRFSPGFLFEYFIPAYGAIVLLRDIIIDEVSIFYYCVVIFVHIYFSVILFKKTSKAFAPSFSFSIHAQGGKND